VQNPALVGVDDVEDLRARQRAHVERLAARCRIEGRPQDDRRFARGSSIDDLRVELTQVRVVMVGRFIIWPGN
jgi:hypothetical protein